MSGYAIITGAPQVYVEGLDLSANNPTPTAAGIVRAYQSGRRFMIAKSSEGQDYKDPAFARFVDLFQKQGFICDISYHFAHPRTDPVVSAKHAVSVVKPMGFKSPVIALDFETDDKDWPPHQGLPAIPPAQCLEWCHTFLRVALEELAPSSGPGVTIYTGAGPWNLLKAGPEWAQIPLWNANWTTGPAPASVVPWGQAWTFWQWAADSTASMGSIPGIPGYVKSSSGPGWQVVDGGPVDCNRFRGSLDDLKGFLSRPTIVPDLLRTSINRRVIAEVSALTLAIGALACAAKALTA